MKFSLVNVGRQRGNLVEGSWVQNHIGTLESATERARQTEAANGNHIIVAVTEEWVSVTPMLDGYCLPMPRLDNGSPASSEYWWDATKGVAA